MGRRGKSWGGVDTVMTIAALGVVGYIGYFMLKSKVGVDEALKSTGDALKSFVDAGNSTGDWIGDGSYWLQKQFGQKGKEAQDIVGGIADAVGDISYDAQKALGLVKRPSGRKPNSTLIDTDETLDAMIENARRGNLKSSSKKSYGPWDFLAELGCGVWRPC